jgi:uncharacterized membrane protein YuzA (DUF378 family)
MTSRTYRLTVIVCALAWFLVGLHWPIVHQMTAHGRTPAWTILAIIAGLAGAGVASVWALLRAPGQTGV